MPAVRRVVSVPRPLGTRAKNRAQLVVTMHPRQLAAIEARAAACSMSLTAYVIALFDSDREDVPGTGNTRRFSLAALAGGETDEDTPDDDDKE